MRDNGMSLTYRQMAPDQKIQRALSVLLRQEARLVETIRGKKELNILDFGCGRVVVYAAGFIDFFAAISGSRKINLVFLDAEEAKVGERAMSAIEQARARCVVVNNLSVIDNADVDELRRRCGIEKFDVITMFNPNAPSFVSQQVLIEEVARERGLVEYCNRLVARGISPSALLDRHIKRNRELVADCTLIPVRDVFTELLAKNGLLFIAAASDALPFGDIRAALRSVGYNIKIDAPNPDKEDPSETFYRHLFVASLNGRPSANAKEKS